nr:hypothetical protein [Rhodococcus wratislaviensis]GLK34656.1 hypothetical protein GCM10017611_15050 [Rhodococcus wratislaviensis]
MTVALGVVTTMGMGSRRDPLGVPRGECVAEVLDRVLVVPHDIEKRMGLVL